MTTFLTERAEITDIKGGRKMPDLSTRYLGIDLKNPLIAGASKLTGDISTIQKLEEAGAAAIVTSSLFEEQIRIEREWLEDYFLDHGGMHQTELNLPSYSPYSYPEDHLQWLKSLTDSISIPVIASLNAFRRETWAQWSMKLEECGIQGLELNFYSTPIDQGRDSSEIEDEQIQVLVEIKEKVRLPISVKMSPFYTNPLNMASRFSKAGADGIVMFNRFFQPDIDPDSMKHIFRFDLSQPMENRLPLRFMALLHGRIHSDLCASSGVHNATDVIKMILGGAAAVQMVSSLYLNGIDHVQEVIRELENWMDSKGFSNINEFRGKMDKLHSSDPYAYERAQYVKILLQSHESLKGQPLI